MTYLSGTETGWLGIRISREPDTTTGRRSRRLTNGRDHCGDGNLTSRSGRLLAERLAGYERKNLNIVI
jgi:hypothetical protein